MCFYISVFLLLFFLLFSLSWYSKPIRTEINIHVTFYRLNINNCFHWSLVVCLSVCLFVCRQDYIKSTEQISTRLGWRMSLGPEWILVSSGSEWVPLLSVAPFSLKSWISASFLTSSPPSCSTCCCSRWLMASRGRTSWAHTWEHTGWCHSLTWWGLCVPGLFDTFMR